MLKRLVLSLLVFAAGSSVAGAELRHAGNVVSTTVGIARVDVALDSGATARIELVADDILRVRFAPSGTFSAFLTGAVVGPGAASVSIAAPVYDTPEGAYIVTDKVIVAIFKQPYRLVIWRADGTLLQADLEPAVSWDTATGFMYTRKWAPPDERYYGFGERGGPLNRRGRSFVMQNKDHAAFDAYTDPLYISIPYFWGARGNDVYGVFLDNAAVPFFSADADASGSLTFGAVAGDLDYYLMTGPSPASVAASYGRITGFSALPPRWSLGYHQSRYGYASQIEVLTVASTLRALALPADVLYFDIDYLDRLQLFSWNLDTFPNPPEMNYLLGQLGFRRVNIMEPVVHDGDRFWQPLSDAGFFLKDWSGASLVTPIWFGNVSWLDFTKTAVTDWYKQMLAGFMGTGIDAVWNDLNEPAANEMPHAIYDFDGHPRPDIEARNLYALKMAETSYEAQRDLRPGTRPWGISRAGFAGIQRYLANWGGDALSDWATLRTNVQMSLSMGLSGQNFFGHDIGGFLGAPDAELFTRWMEFAAYTPLFRNHAMNTSPAREPWAFGEPTLARSREILNERYRLLPFFYTLFEEASRSGQPALTPVFFHFPADEHTWNDDTSFMVGDAMLVAPVLEPGVTSRLVYLPGDGTWLDAYSAAPYAAGQTHTVAAPLGRIPVFVKAGAIVPKGPVMQHTDERPLNEVHVHLYRGPESSFTMYEDDGATFAYQSGTYLRTRITRRDDGTMSRCVIERIEGAMAPPADRAWYLEFRDVPVFAFALVNGVVLPPVASEAGLATVTSGWARAADGHVIVKTPDTSAAITVELYRVN